MNDGSLAELVRSEVPIVGTFLQGSRPGAAQRSLVEAGLDFVVIDMECTTYDLKDVEAIGHTCIGLHFPWLVRLPDDNPSTIARVLELGSSGIVVPSVESSEQALRIMKAVSVSPLGGRGWSPTIASLMRLGNGADDRQARLRNLNETSMVVVQIETVKGVENALPILQTPGLDAVLIGPGDLSLSFGVPGELDHPLVTNAARHVRRIASSTKVAFGMHCVDVLSAQRWAREGVSLLTLMSDVSIMRSAFAVVLPRIRES